MAEALVKGLLSQEVVAPSDIYISDHKQKRCDSLSAEYKVQASVGGQAFLSVVDVLFLIQLFACQFNLVCIHYDYVVTAVYVRCKAGLVFSS